MNNAIDEKKCPVCGASNSCHFAEKENSEHKSCWCENTEYAFPVDLFTRIPAKFKDKACICETCAQLYRKVD
jgi:hypothetical protein